MAIGDCRLFKATISGFDHDHLNPAAAGWTQLTGTGDVGQSATELAVVDNGLVRVTLEKNGGANGASLRIYGFDGTAWDQAVVNESDFKNATVTAVRKNTELEIELEITAKDRNDAVDTYRLRVQRALPVVEFYVVAYGASANSVRCFSGNTGDTNKHMVLATATQVFDAFPAGNISRAPTLTADNWVVLLTEKDLDVVFASTKASFFQAFESASQHYAPCIRGANQVAGSYFWVIVHPRAYANNGGAASKTYRREAEENQTVNSGTWAEDTTDASSKSNGKTLKNTTALDSDEVQYAIRVPHAGKWLVGARARTASGSRTLSVNLDGETIASGTLPTTAWTANPAVTVAGPFTVAGGGDKILKIKPGGAYEVDLDALYLIPVEETSATPATAIGPKNVAHHVLHRALA